MYCGEVAPLNVNGEYRLANVSEVFGNCLNNFEGVIAYWHPSDKFVGG
jgi:hypothetical protein